MAGSFKRKSDLERRKNGKYTCWWIGADGKKKMCPGTTNKAQSDDIARAREAEAKMIREGLVDPAERSRRESSLRSVGDHVVDYRLDLLARGGTSKHASHVAGAILRLLGSADVTSIAEIVPDRVQAALGRMKAAGKSSRTCNHALGSTKAFATWLHDSGRIKDFPRGLAKIDPYPEKGDRRRVRRPLTLDELAKLVESTELQPAIVATRAGRGGKVTSVITGPERAMVYRIAMATGFRANEIRTLIPERFHLDGENPSITVVAAYSKRGKHSGRDDVQPIRRDMADTLRPWLATRPPGVPVLSVPDRTAEMLAADLIAAGIKPVDARGRVVDFHALRHSYVTGLVMAGVNPKVVQRLARHSTITLTLDRYTTVEDEDLRDALEDSRTTNAPSPESDSGR